MERSIALPALFVVCFRPRVVTLFKSIYARLQVIRPDKHQRVSKSISHFRLK